MVFRIGRARHPPVQDQRVDSLGMGGREQDGERNPFGKADESGPLDTRRVHHGADVIHPLLERRHLGDRVRQTGPSLVEEGQTGERSETFAHVPNPRLLAADLKVAYETRNHDDVEIRVSDHHVGDVDVAALRVPDLTVARRPLHARHPSPGLTR